MKFLHSTIAAIAFVCCASNSYCQSVYIPDAALRGFLETFYPNCMTNGSLDTQCSQVVNETLLQVGSIGMSDATGIEYFVGLETLNISNNSVSSLSSLGSNLVYLNCEGNNLSTLPNLPPGLQRLFAGENQLNELPPLPSTLEVLSVHDNNLIALPALPMGLLLLSCFENQLTELPSLPNSLARLSCRGNELVELPVLPHSLTYMSASDNQLECLPVLPPNMDSISIGANNLQCVPNRPEGVEFNAHNLAFFAFPFCFPNNVGGCPVAGNVSGTVYFDQIQNCVLEVGEVGLPYRVIETSLGQYGITDSLGFYYLQLDSGSYEIWQHQPNWLWEVACPTVPYQTSLISTTDSVSGLDFGNQVVDICPWLWVDVSPSLHRPCFSTGTYHVNYCNQGTEAETDAYVELTFPTEIIPTGSSIPWQNLGGGVYSFDVGDLDAGECGGFYVSDSVSCDTEVGETVCVTAEIFPISPCLISTAGSGWDNASVVVNGGCNGSTIDFEVKNIGSGNMDSPSAYRLYEDDILIEEGTIAALTASQSYIMSVASTGMTYRLEVDQRDGHPGASLPRSTVETCGPTPHSLGFVMTTTENDFDDFVEIACTELSAAFDPNDKQVIPSGYGSENYVTVEDSLLEYRIRFQNTGNDTAFTVVVVDTLPSVELNPGTFISGASSHPYTVMMYDNGIVSWRFENILLPDSTTNEPASHGFVKFKIKTRPGLALGTVINNSAAIYFDYNDPIITNTSFVTIEEEQTVTGLKDVNEEAGLSVYPNPTTGELFLSVDAMSNISVVSICDMTGREVLRRPFAQQLDISELSSGNYILSVYSENDGVIREKLVVQ